VPCDVCGSTVHTSCICPKRNLVKRAVVLDAEEACLSTDSERALRRSRRKKKDVKE